MAGINSVKKRAEQAFALFGTLLLLGNAGSAIAADKDQNFLDQLRSGKGILSQEDLSSLPEEALKALAESVQREAAKAQKRGQEEEQLKKQNQDLTGKIDKLDKQNRKKGDEWAQEKMMDMILGLMMNQMFKDSFKRFGEGAPGMHRQKQPPPKPKESWLPWQTESVFEKDKEWEAHPTIKKYLKEAEQRVILGVKTKFGEEQMKKKGENWPEDKKKKMDELLKEDSLNLLNDYLSIVVPPAKPLKKEGNPAKLLDFSEKTLKTLDDLQKESLKEFGDHSLEKMLKQKPKLFIIPIPPPTVPQSPSIKAPADRKLDV